MNKEELIKTATDILGRVYQKNIVDNVIFDVVNSNDEQILLEWKRQLDLYLLNVNNQKVVEAIEAQSPIYKNDRVSKERLQSVIDILTNYKEK